MSIFVETLKRAYINNLITLVKLDSLKTNNKIIQEEYDYIIA